MCTPEKILDCKCEMNKRTNTEIARANATTMGVPIRGKTSARCCRSQIFRAPFIEPSDCSRDELWALTEQLSDSCFIDLNMCE